MLAESVRIRVRTGDFEIEVEGADATYVEDRIQRYLAEYGKSESPRLPLRNAFQGGNGNGEKPMSLQEFVKRIAPSKDTEYVVAVAYFCEKYEGISEIRTRDISDRFQKYIKYKHSNPADAVARAKKQGLLMPTGTGSTFVVTNTGEEWVEQRATLADGE